MHSVDKRLMAVIEYERCRRKTERGETLVSYQALYRTWRPEYFRDIVGQDRIVTTLINQITSGRIPHAYLFCGSRGTGKTTTAKVLSRAINCLNPESGEPCGHCEA